MFATMNPITAPSAIPGARCAPSADPAATAKRASRIRSTARVRSPRQLLVGVVAGRVRAGFSAHMSSNCANPVVTPDTSPTRTPMKAPCIRPAPPMSPSPKPPVKPESTTVIITKMPEPAVESMRSRRTRPWSRRSALPGASSIQSLMSSPPVLKSSIPCLPHHRRPIRLGPQTRQRTPARTQRHQRAHRPAHQQGRRQCRIRTPPRGPAYAGRKRAHQYATRRSRLAGQAFRP
jgi:hypothetical protein